MTESNNSGQYQKLPPGWDCKLDQATGNCYYINYLTKAMQLEDPRIRYKQLQNERCSTESIPMQPLHGSPYHVYPSNNLPAMRAFQAGPVSNVHSGWQHMSSSPLLSSRGNLEMSPLPFPKLPATQTPRLGNLSRRSTIQETSFSNQIDTDAVVAKIQNMFPTANENHIRLLLRRYYNREAVVISALQVEKHPVTMPGPFVTPPAQRHLFHSNSAFQMTPPLRRLDIGHSVGYTALLGGGSGTSRTASPLPGGRFGGVNSMNSSGRGGNDGATLSHTTGTGAFSYPATSSVLYHGSPRFGEQWRSSPKPHSSPKMKLRYMKNIFPKADEMLLLDVLASADNNVQKASQTLISLGYAKRDFLAQKPPNQTSSGPGSTLEQNKSCSDKIIPLRPKEYTQEEKDSIQQRFKEKYHQIAERIIAMALESVNYSEDRAIQILQIVQEEEADLQRVRNAAAQKASEVSLTAPDGIAHMGMMPTTLQDATVVSSGTDNILTVVVEEAPATIDTNKNVEDKDKDNNDSKNNIASDKRQENTNKNDNQNNGTLDIDTIINQETTTTTTLSTSPSSSKSLVQTKSVKKIKKLAFPSINLTTPTTATTQIILSSSPIYVEEEIGISSISSIDHESSAKDIPTIKSCTIQNPSSSSSQPILSPSKPSDSSFDLTSSFRTITLKGMLARCNKNAIRRNISSSVSNSSTASGTASLLAKLKITSRPRDKSDTLKYVQRDEDDLDATKKQQQQEFKSILGRIASMGPNNELSRGPDESLLLADYVTWNGANPDISVGQRNLAVGTDASLLSEHSYIPHGRNAEHCKGPKIGLAKGSIYAQLSAAKGSKSANIKCN